LNCSHIQYSPYGNTTALTWLKAFGISFITLHSYPLYNEEKILYQLYWQYEMGEQTGASTSKAIDSDTYNVRVVGRIKASR
jgi:hypothetical protein